MTLIVLVIHLFICIGLVFLVLLQRSEGGALGMGGGGGSGSLMSGRGAADALAKLTQIAGGMFLATSLLLTVLSGAARTNEDRSIFDGLGDRLNFNSSAPVDAPLPPTDDPLESALPDPSLAAAPASEPVVVAPAPGANSERAGPVTTAPAPRQTAAPAANTSRQASNTTTRPPANASSGSTTTPAPPPAALAPTEVAPPTPESSETPAGVEVVRRDRAGPDQ